MWDEVTLTWIKRMLVLTLILIIILLIFVKKFFNSGADSENLTKKLMNFISNEGKEGMKNSNYDTIGGEKGYNRSYNSNNSKSKNSNKKSEEINLNVNLNNKACSNAYNDEMEHSDSLSRYIEKETNERINKLLRFGVDYCRASPNITLRNSKTLLNIGWRSQKFNYDVEFETINYKGEKQAIHSIMSAVPINKSFLNFDDDFVRDSYCKVLDSLSHNNKYIMPCLHFDILPSQKLMLKIQKLNEFGSLRDLLYKSYPLNTFVKKYPQMKGKGLHTNLIITYSKQILEALHFLHSNKWYHMHLHTGNILIDDEGNSVKLSDLDNFVNDLPIRNEHLLNYAFESFNSSHYMSNKNDYNSSVLSEIFKSNFNIFEKIDIICFGRVLYEMTTGRELKAPCPDNLEYKEVDAEIANILGLIFNKKEIGKGNSKFAITVPDVTAQDLLKLKIFSGERDRFKDDKSFNEKSSHLDSESNHLFGQYDSYCSFIKENIFNQSKYLKIKLKAINSYLNK